MTQPGQGATTAALWFSGIATFAAAVALFFNYADQHNRQVDRFEDAKQRCTVAAASSFQTSERVLLATHAEATALPVALWDAYLDFGVSYFPILNNCFGTGVITGNENEIAQGWAEKATAARGEVTTYMRLFGHEATSPEEYLAQRLTLPAGEWESVAAYRDSVDDILLSVDDSEPPPWWLPWDWK